MNIKQQSKDSGIPEEEIMMGLSKAINEFLDKYNEWSIHKHYTNNNGLTIISKTNK
jgi:hypothetical protein